MLHWWWCCEEGDLGRRLGSEQGKVFGWCKVVSSLSMVRGFCAVDVYELIHRMI